MPTLNKLNRISPADARDFFFSCCGSTRWAESMASCRPYWNIQVVFNAADVIWQYLADDDRREALRNRTIIGDDELPSALREDLEFYKSKFGYEFVTAAALPSHDELQTTIRRRLEYSLRAEFDLSASEEFAIMQSEIRKRLSE